MKQEPFKLWFIAITLVAFMFTWASVSSSQDEGLNSVVPTVTAMTPTDGAIAVTLNQPITATFSQRMSILSINAGFVLQGPNGTLVRGKVNYYGRAAIFRPAVALAPNTTYTARVRGGVSDLAGVALGHAFVWSFTTGATTDTTEPTVSFTNPANAAVNVPINQKIVVIFSEDMSPGSLNTATFHVTRPNGARIAGTVVYTSGSATFGPLYDLKSNTHYIATITTVAKDLARNTLAAKYVWSFDTGANLDVVRPTVISMNPIDDASSVPIAQTVNVTFSKAMNYATITTGDFI